MTIEMASQHHVDVVVIGGGLCGVLAGQRCTMEGLSYTIVEKEDDFGGVWGTLANNHSHLQVCLRCFPIASIGIGHASQGTGN